MTQDDKILTSEGFGGPLKSQPRIALLLRLERWFVIGALVVMAAGYGYLNYTAEQKAEQQREEAWQAEQKRIAAKEKREWDAAVQQAPSIFQNNAVKNVEDDWI